MGPNNSLANSLISSNLVFTSPNTFQSSTIARDFDHFRLDFSNIKRKFIQFIDNVIIPFFDLNYKPKKKKTLWWQIPSIILYYKSIVKCQINLTSIVSTPFVLFKLWGGSWGLNFFIGDQWWSSDSNIVSLCFCFSKSCLKCTRKFTNFHFSKCTVSNQFIF